MAGGVDLSRAPALTTWEEVQRIATRLERLDAKLDAVLGLSTNVDGLEERLRQLELWRAGADQRTSSWAWVRDAVLALVLAIIGAGVWLQP